jgi:hypothetical protein
MRCILLKTFLIALNCFTNAINANTCNTSFKNCQKNFSISLEGLFLKPSAKTVTATNVYKPVLTTANYTTTKALNPSLGWGNGFKIEGSSRFNKPNWSHTLSWTSYRTSATKNYQSEIDNSINLNQVASFPAWNISPTTLSSDYANLSSLNWHLLVNMIELIFQKSYCYKSLSFYPSVGLTTGWINQNFGVEYLSGTYQQTFIYPGLNNDTPVNIYMKNNYWGLGPNIGLASDIYAKNGFGLYGHCSFAPLIGNYHVNQEGQYLEQNIFYKSKNQTGISCLINACLGFVYKKAIFENRYNVSCRLSYEFYEFFNIYQLEKDRYNVISRDSNLSLQGVSVSICMDY